MMATSDTRTLEPAPRPEHRTDTDVLSVRDVDVPSADPIARSASWLIGGPLGRYARVGRALPWAAAAMTAAIVATLNLAAGVLQKGHCVANGWNVPDAFWRACYSDMPVLFTGTPLMHDGFPYTPGTGSLAQPPLTGLVMWLTAFLVPDNPDWRVRQAVYFAIWAIVLLAMLVLTVRAVARSSRRDPWRAMHVAASPVLLTAGLVAPDLLGVGLATYAMWLWSRNKPEWAGVLFGLAIAARTYPILIVLVIGVLALRAGRFSSWAAMAGTALLTAVAAILAVFGVGKVFGGLRGLGDVASILSAYRQWAAGSPDYGSLWYLPRAAGIDIAPTTAVGLAIMGWVVALLAGAFLALSAPRRPTIGEVSLVVVGIVLLTGRSLPVQVALWLVPLVALAGLRWRDHLIWASGELLYFVAIWLYLGGQQDVNRSMPVGWLVGASVLRLAGILWLVVAAWRQARRRPVATPRPYAVDPAVAGASGAGAVPDPDGVERDQPLHDESGHAVATAVAGGRRADRQVSDVEGDREEIVLDPELEADPLAGPMAGRRDRLTVAVS